MQGNTEENADQCAQDCQKSNLYGRQDGELRDGFNEKQLIGYTEGVGDAVGYKGTDHAWNQCNVVHDPHTDHLHGKDGSSHRCAEECGESGTHAAHDHDMLILFVKAEQASDGVAKTSAQLESRAFASGRTSEEVCDQC